MKKKIATKSKSEWEKNVMKILQILLFFWGEKSFYFASQKKRENMR